MLGNDPFERGAAVRPPADVPRPVSPPGPSSPRSVDQAAPEPIARVVAEPGPSGPPPSPVDAAAARLDGPAARADASLDGAEARLADLAARTGAATYAEELRELLVRLLPALKDRLKPLAGLATLLASPGRLDPFGRDEKFEDGARLLLDFLYETWWRVDVRGTDAIPAGPAMVVANHGGALPWDALVLRLAARRPPAGRDLRALLDEAALATALVGTVSRRLGAVPASGPNLQAILEAGALAGVFPEGSRAGGKPWGERYRLQRFGRGGFVRVAARAGVPMVPCAIVGSEEVSAPFGRQGWMAEALGLPLLGLAAAIPFAPLAWLPLPSRWSVRFGPPIPPPPLDRADDPAAIGAGAEEVRAALQRMLDEDLAARRSVFL